MTTATMPNGAKPAATTAPEQPNLIDEIIASTSDRMDARVRQVNRELESCPATAYFRRLRIQAAGIRIFREMLTPAVMKEIMEGMNTPLGFLTDKDPAKSRSVTETYPAEVVRECMIAAFLQGVFPVGNEMNILFGTCYVTKEGYRRKFREIPGAEDPEFAADAPVFVNGRPTVRVSLRWRQDGKWMELRDPEGKPGITVPVKVTKGMEDSALVGKAERAAWKRAYEVATGRTVGADDDGLAEGEIPNEPAPPAAAETPAPETPKPVRTVIDSTQHDNLRRLLKLTGADLHKFLGYFDCSDTDLLPEARYGEAVAMLEAKRRQAGAEAKP